jgi:hypothetical protein
VKRILAAAAVLSASTVGMAQDPPPAPSRAQANVGLDAGLAGVGSGSFWSETRLLVGARGDVLFGRNNPAAFGYGPMLGVATYGFKDISFQGGGSLLLPVHDYLPFVLSAGPYVRKDDAWEPGAFGTLFWGTRSFNYHSNYGMAAGLQIEGRVGFGDSRERTILLAVHLDAEAMALPVVMLINLFR